MPLVKWMKIVDKDNGDWCCWDLVVEHREPYQSTAPVLDNGVWHTWDRNGVGGENSSETSFRQAKLEAAASAIAQGFI